MKRLKVVALAGGVGGAKFADGLAQVLDPDDLVIVVNTGDDFIHMGLSISPDLDTVCYTLAGIANPDTGWGLKNETWNVLSRLKEMGMPVWFQLGDSDLATHIVRTNHLVNGRSLSQITTEFCRVWGIKPRVLPMTDDDVRTWVDTNNGKMEFQEYFVHQKCLPVIKEIQFIGAEIAQPAPGVVDAIDHADAIILCPSNPWVSIDPILSIPGIRSALQDRLTIAVSPIIGTRAVKGPAAKMFTEFGLNPSAFSVAEHYRGIIDGIFIDNIDYTMTEDIQKLGIRAFNTGILMVDQADRGRLAQEVIETINEWGSVNS